MLETLTRTKSFQKVPLSPEPVYRLLFGRPMTQILLAAFDLGVFKALQSGAKSVDVLSRELQLPSASLETLLNTGVALGLFTKADGSFANAPVSANYLVPESPFYLGGLIAHFREQVFPAWDHLQKAVEENGPQMQSAVGGNKTDIFQITPHADRSTELFISAMHNLTVSDGLTLAENFDFSPFKHLIDIGGGSGALCLSVASRYPSLRASVLDRPQVCRVAESYIADSGLKDRVSTIPADAFQDSLNHPADAIVMSLFVHAFGLEKCAPLLRRCYDALPSGGVLLIYEPVLNPDRTGPLTTLLSSLNMLVCTPSGGDVTAEDYSQWLRAAGFTNVFYKPVPAIRHLIGGYKP